MARFATFLTVLALAVVTPAEAQESAEPASPDVDLGPDIGDPGEEAAEDSAEAGEPAVDEEPAEDEVDEEPAEGVDEEPAEGADEEQAAEEAEEREDTAEEPTEEPALSPQAERELALLRALEARLSVGEELTEPQRAVLVRLAEEGSAPAVRALAAAVLPWLGPEVVLDALVKATDDEDARVRAQALSGLVALSRRLSDPQAAQVRELALRALDDRSDEVACSAARLLVAVDPDGAVDILDARADEASDVRFGCYRQYGGLPMREIEVPAPELPEPPLVSARPEDQPDDEEGRLSLRQGLGGGIFLATAAGAGAVAGGLVNNALFPARDTLTYTRQTTSHAREEPNVLVAGAGALAGGAALGAAAFGLQYVAGPLDFAPATSVLGLTAAGAAGGYGLALSLNLSQPWQGLSLIGGTLGGFAVSAPVAYLLPPTERDLTMIAAASGAATLTGALAAFTVIPEGYPVLFDRVRRADFGTGLGLMVGSAGAVSALALSPLVDISHGRMLASSGTALGMGSLALASGFLIPVAFDEMGLGVTRSRVAAGAALVVGWLSGAAVFVLLPDSWASVFERVKAERTPSAVALEEGELKLGIPSVWSIDLSRGEERRTAVGLDLFRGSF